MAKRKTSLYQKELKKIINQLMAYSPQRIILFGSVSKGKEDEASDIDLLIVKQTNKPFHQRIKEVLDLIDSVKVEPLVFTPEEIKERLTMKDFFIARILKEGKVLYEKA